MCRTYFVLHCYCLIKIVTKYNIDFTYDSFSLAMIKDIREALKAISRRKESSQIKGKKVKKLRIKQRNVRLGYFTLKHYEYAKMHVMVYRSRFKQISPCVLCFCS